MVNILADLQLTVDFFPLRLREKNYISHILLLNFTPNS